MTPVCGVCGVCMCVAYGGGVGSVYMGVCSRGCVYVGGSWAPLHSEGADSQDSLHRSLVVAPRFKTKLLPGF